jgi:hypothetical protein
MNLGTWSIVAYSGMATAAAIREYFRHDPSTRERTALRHIDNPLLLAIHDLAGVPFALMVAGYTGVLLSCTSNPLWCRNTWLGPLFGASSIATGAEAVSLALDLGQRDVSPAASRALMRIDTLAHATEAAASAAFMRSAGERARPLREGRMRRYRQVSTTAIVLAEALKMLPLDGKAARWVRVASAALGLVGGFAMRWAMVHGGHEAAADPRLASRPPAAAETPGVPPAGAPERVKREQRHAVAAASGP